MFVFTSTSSLSAVLYVFQNTYIFLCSHLIVCKYLCVSVHLCICTYLTSQTNNPLLSLSFSLFHFSAVNYFPLWHPPLSFKIPQKNEPKDPTKQAIGVFARVDIIEKMMNI